MKTFCPGPPGRGDAIARGRIFHDDFEQRAFFMPLPSCQRRTLGKDRVFPLVFNIVGNYFHYPLTTSTRGSLGRGRGSPGRGGGSPGRGRRSLGRDTGSPTVKV